MNLENIVKKEFGKEVAKNFRDNIQQYPQRVKDNSIEMIPAFCVGALGTYFAQTFSQDIFNDEIINSLAGYAGGYVGFVPYFSLHFLRNKEKYFGEENKGKMFEYARDFIVTDWFADMVSYAPVYGFVDQFLQRTPEIQDNILGFHFEAGETGVVASFAGMVTYILAMSALMPVSQEISKRGRNKIKEEIISEEGQIIKGHVYNTLQHFDKYLPILQTIF